MHPTGADPAAETAELFGVMSSMLDEAIRAYPAAEQPAGCWWLPRRYGGGAPSLEEAAALDAEEKAARAARKAARPAAGESPPS
jgi:hypothetical protein